MQILEKNVFLHFKTFFTNNGFERRSLFFWVTEIGEIIGFRVSFLWENLKISLYEISSKRRLNSASSVNLNCFLTVLPQFEQLKEVCLHAGHASVHVNSLNNVYEMSGTWRSESLWYSKMFLNHVLINSLCLLSTGRVKGHRCRTSTYWLFISGKWIDSWSLVMIFKIRG